MSNKYISDALLADESILQYEKMIFCDFYGLKIWGSCLEVHLFVLEPFCIENNRKTRKNGYFLRYHQKWKLYGHKTPFNWLIILCWTSGDTLQWFLKFSSFPGRSAGVFTGQIGTFLVIFHVLGWILWALNTPIPFLTR